MNIVRMIKTKIEKMRYKLIILINIEEVDQIKIKYLEKKLLKISNR